MTKERVKRLDNTKGILETYGTFEELPFPEHLKKKNNMTSRIDMIGLNGDGGGQGHYEEMNEKAEREDPIDCNDIPQHEPGARKL